MAGRPDVRAVYHQATPADGRALGEKLIAALPSCPIPEVARLGKTLRTWRAAFLAYFDTGGASNGGTEAINGLIELHRRVVRGFRNRESYRLRMLLIAGGPRHPDLACPTSTMKSDSRPPALVRRAFSSCAEPT